MADQKLDDQQPRRLHGSKSFSKLDPNPAVLARGHRANTTDGVIPEVITSAPGETTRPRLELNTVQDRKGPDGREVGAATEEKQEPASVVEELPIELISLTDSFLDSLNAKVHTAPPSIDKLSGLFQDFYSVAANHINTHVQILSSRLTREAGAGTPTTPLSSTASKIRAKAASIGNKEKPKQLPDRRDSDQQMLTADEIADRKRARKGLEQKRLALEEAVERKVCESIYAKIWRHRSTQDEEQDEKLRSKTAALSVVGIGLKDLGVDLGVSDNPDVDRANEVKEWLETARHELVAMNDQQYPLGKLQHLKAAHKSIVDTLSHFHPSSSADEIMPMLIYTLITSRPEGINVISNLYFVQRFRNEAKIDGEAAYCLTNLEAAITFLETVDLASLRADEIPSGPTKPSSRSSTPLQKLDPVAAVPPILAPTLTPINVSQTTVRPPLSPDPKSATAPSNRRLSGMFQPPAQVLGAAGDAVLSTADQGFKTIGNSLGESYKFFVGRLMEREKTSPGTSSEIVVPKTLDDARKLIGTPGEDDEGSVSGESSLHTPEVTGRKRGDSGARLEDRILNVIGGRPARDRSTDSTRSSGSNDGKRVAFAEEVSKVKNPSPLHVATPTTPNPAIVESMRNLGNTLNPMNRITGMGMMRGFGRASASSATTKAPEEAVPDLTSAFPDLAAVLPQKEGLKIAPPKKRFLELDSPGDLKLNEVLELLRDYRRLAGALKDMNAF